GDHQIMIWNPSSAHLHVTLESEVGQFTHLAWSPDSRTLASASWDRTIGLWDPVAGRQVKELEGHTSLVTCVAFSEDGAFLASKANDGTVRLWDATTGELLATIPIPDPADSLPREGLTFHPRAALLAAAADDERTIRVWRFDKTR